MSFNVDLSMPKSEERPVSRSAGSWLQDLQARCAAQATEMESAAENIETHGVKLLLKAYAQQRVGFGRALRRILTQIGPGQTEDSTGSRSEAESRVETGPSGHGVKQGARDLAASLTVPREQRRVVALAGVVDGERALLQAYTHALQADLPVEVRDLVERQRNQVAAGYDRLIELSGQGSTEPVTRVFARPRVADEALAQLARAGFTSQVEVFDVDNLPVHPTPPAQMRRSVWSTVRAGALAGALLGAVVGLAWALAQSAMPGMALDISMNPWLLLLISTVVTAFWGAIFGWLIGRSKVEDDRFVYQDSLVNGTRLVVVYAAPERRAEAQRILQVYHDRELHKE
ncbi:MAG: hypothetical protein DCC57_16210 [Chloroflexi bacterium]|nr:MAG: hypothetical protein DCC57_16210 [Chloroflexota bacterium]